MSEVIKSSCVLLDREPKVLKIETEPATKAEEPETESNPAVYVEAILEQNAKESAELALRTALRKAKEITDRANIEANMAYNEALNAGRDSGYEAGLNDGREEGEKTAEQMVVSAAQDFLDSVTSLDEKLYQKLSEDRADCIDFAFNLASKILNIEIDRNKSEYQEILSDFMTAHPVEMTLSADGKDYSFKTLRADEILELSKDMSHISLVESISGTKIDDIYNKEEKISKTSADVGNLTTINPATDSSDSNNENEPEGNSYTEIKQANNNESAYEEIVRPDEETDEENDEQIDYYEPEEGMVQSEKFVFIRSSIRSVKIPKDGSDSEKFTFSDIKYLSQEILKSVVKKANIKDLSAALTGADEDISNAMLSAMSNKNREKVLDAIRYLGPIPESEIDAARKRIVQTAYEINRERSRA